MSKVNSQKTHRPSERSCKSRFHHGGFQARTTVLRKSRELHPPDTALSSRVSESPSETFASEQVYSSLESFCTHAILDTGACRCIIGEKTMNRLQQSLPKKISDRFRRRESQVKFRFGNNQSLTSTYAIQIPLKHRDAKKLWMSVEVVPGATPFVFQESLN